MTRKLLTAAFDTEESFLAATCAARDGGLAIHDTFTPYFVHGMDQAMGLRPSRLGIVCFALGLGGLISALAFMLWSHVIFWPQNIGGKSDPAVLGIIPVAFEFTILSASVGTMIVFLLRTKLWPGQSATMIAPGITDDRFILVLEVDKNSAKARELLEAGNALEIREVETT